MITLLVSPMNGLSGLTNIIDKIVTPCRAARSFCITTEYDHSERLTKMTWRTANNSEQNYSFTYDGNKLTCVDDAVTATSYTGGTNFVNGASTSNEYTYDQNGNLTKDLNKEITDIQILPFIRAERYQG